LNRWLSHLGWAVAGAAALCVPAVVVDRAWPVVAEAGLSWAWITLVLAGLALIASVVWTALTRENLAISAARLDVAAGLKERLSSALFCEGAADPFAQAVVADARRVGGHVSVRQHLPVRVPPSANYAGGTLLIALLVFWLCPTIDLAGKQAERDNQRQQQEMVKRAEAQVKPVLEQVYKKLAEQNPAIKKELENLEPIKADGLTTPTDVRNQAIKQINNVRQQLENKANDKDLTKVGEFKKMLRQLTMEQTSNSPVAALAQALANGDFKAAQAAIAALKQELAKQPRTPEEQQRAEALKQQLEQLSNRINQIAQADNKVLDSLAEAKLTKDELKKALENISKQDLEALRKQLAEKGLSKEQIDKLVRNVEKRCSACALASRLGSNLAKGGQGSGNVGQLSESAAQGLTAAGQQLSEMESLEQQLGQLASASADMDALKNQIGQACSACQGTGMRNGQACSLCQGTGMCPGEGGRGPGMGRQGQGEGGVAPKQETDVKTVQKHSPVNTLAGSIIDQRFVNGEQYAGEVSDEFVNAVISAQRDITDATPLKPLPRVYQRARADYFRHAADDLPESKVKAAEANVANQSPPATQAGP